MNTSAPLAVLTAEERVLGWQTRLHRWAVQDEQQRFGDLFNLVCDPATLLVAWERVKRNRGSQTAGVDGQTRKIVERMGVDGVLSKLRQELKDGTYRPLPARERLIPKRSGAPRSYEWVIEGDVEDCFGQIHQGLLMEQVRRRVTDKRVLALIRQFLAAGIMREQGSLGATPSGMPQGSLCAAAHKPPYEQRWVMRSAGL